MTATLAVPLSSELKVRPSMRGIPIAEKNSLPVMFKETESPFAGEGGACGPEHGDGLHAAFDLLLHTDRTDLIGSMREIGSAGVERKDEHVVLVEASVHIVQVNE